MNEVIVVQKTQKIVVDPASSSIAIISAGPPGPAGPLDSASVALLDDKVDKLTGVGTPEGVVTASIGSQYIDTSAEEGDVLVWIKTVNAGNTGWLAMYTIPV